MPPVPDDAQIARWRGDRGLRSAPRPVPAHAGRRLGLVLITRGLSAAEIQAIAPARDARVRECGAQARLLAA